ncbi:unnamed protein product [Tilletia controversa]|uniref:FAD-binding domain-containing protein n=1 Tax=Tilletia controversa TaxID=13291 RepID=A0A8X7MVJ2_9BASI|nr:hypothetical protein CF328_g2117 [Tilletia controversa]KAE8251574.1 hypothetical protein A4X06_0g2620 [Tilletia controversa]CAD6898257.1 unnamed protein product [Tilletia controversa]CAD6901249.1 unnamed protein product [Tilletia controversa]CAD6911306.1 unnamed protein product [Tilletia controversa]
MTDSRRILISGAGIAGPVLSYWLGRAGIHSTIVERAPDLRTNGQTIDIRGKARKVIADMGVEQKIRDACTQEEGLYFVDADDKVLSAFPVDKENGNSATCDIEILRYKLCSLFVDASKDTTEYIFSDSIKDIKQTEREAVVEFESGKKESYDVVVLADGMFSRARSLVFPKEGEENEIVYDSLGLKTAYFSIPYVPEDDGTWSRWRIAPGARNLWLRPDGKSKTPTTRAFMMTRNKEALRRFENYRKLDIAAQKKIWREVYQGAGWKTQRVLDAMDASTGSPDDDFYMQDIAQIKTKKWSKGRVVLLGDAGYCPSPMSGMGTSCAIVGAYVLGNELAKQPNWADLDQVSIAFESYDKILRPYIEESQDIPRALFNLVYPNSNLAVRLIQICLMIANVLVNSVWLNAIFAKVSETIRGGKPEEDKSLRLPEYGH